jgi:ribosome assembly protein SQT1
MATSNPQEFIPHGDEDTDNATEEFLDPNDVDAEVPDDDDHPMEGDDDDVEPGTLGEDDIVWEDNSIQQFNGHEGSVFAVSAHPTQRIAVSGGQDDLGYIWNTENGEQIAKLTGHTDSVASAAFSNDGELIATGGMDGHVRLWRRFGKDASYTTWEFLTELQGPDEVMVS